MTASTCFSRARAALLLPAMMLAIAGCVSRGPLVGPDRLAVQRVPSPEVEFGDVFVRARGQGLYLDGTVHFADALVGKPRHRLAVTISDQKGKVLYAATVSYHRHGRPSKKSDDFSFSLAIPLMPPADSVARLIDEVPAPRR